MKDNNNITKKNTNTHWANGWTNIDWDLYAKLRYPSPNPLGVKINTKHLAQVLKVRYELNKN